MLARAALEHAHRVGDPALELVEAALRDADAAGMAVVDEDRRLAGVLVDVRREAADVPAVAHRPERQERDHRVLGGVERGEQRRHRLEAVEVPRARDVPDRLGLERRRGQVELHGVDRRLVADALTLVGDDLLGHRDATEREARGRAAARRAAAPRCRSTSPSSPACTSRRRTARRSRAVRAGRARARATARPGGGRPRPRARSSTRARARRCRAANRSSRR